MVVVVRRRQRRVLRRLRRMGDLCGGVRQAVVLLPLHPAVLEPDLDLALCEAELVRHLDAAAPRQVPVVVELLLQFEGLVPRV